MTTKVGSLRLDQKTIIGRGSYGTTVFNGLYIHKAVAVKRILRSEVNELVVQQEVELMKKAIDHPHILRYICTDMNDDLLDDDDPWEDDPWVLIIKILT